MTQHAAPAAPTLQPHQHHCHLLGICQHPSQHCADVCELEVQRQALEAAARTAGQAFIAVVAAKLFAGPPQLTAMWHETIAVADFAGGSAVLAALAAFGLNVRKPVTPETPPT